MTISKTTYYTLIAMMLLGLNACSKDESISPPIEDNWQLIWADEFNYEGLPNDEFWSFETGYVRNDEKQYYTNQRLENCIAKDGYLQITALNDNYNNQTVTSASIETHKLISFKYGRIEARAKMPHEGSGTWPAIWTKGDNFETVGWPYCGEIDIMEWVGRVPTAILGSVYTKGENSTKTNEGHQLFVANNASFLRDNFHIYAIEWDSVSISYFVDDINYGTLFKSDFGEDWEPLTKSHYLKINLAMGGEIPPLGGGGTIDYSGFPYTFLVDYVRYYQKIE